MRRTFHTLNDLQIRPGSKRCLVPRQSGGGLTGPHCDSTGARLPAALKIKTNIGHQGGRDATYRRSSDGA